MRNTTSRTTGSGLADSVFENATRQPDFVQFSRRVAENWQDVTSRQFRDDVVAMAKGLLAQGVRPGSSVGIMASNSYEWTLFDYALWSLGAISVPLYPTASSEQVEVALSRTGAMGCVIDNDDHVMTLARIMSHLPGLTNMWELHKGAVSSTIEAGLSVPDSVVLQHRQSVGPSTVASVVYTSGTTGQPKGCVLTHGNLAAQADGMLEHAREIIYGKRGKTAPSTLLFLPLSHVFGRTVQICALRGGVKLAHHSSMTAAGLMSDLATFRPTFLLGVPYIFDRVLHVARQQAQLTGRSATFEKAREVAVAYARASVERKLHRAAGPSAALRLQHRVYDRLVYQKIREAFGGNLKKAISGGSALNPEVGLFFHGAGITVYEGYGLTESCAGVSCNPSKLPKFGTVGKPVPGIEVRIAQDGEVMLRGEQIFSRYLHDNVSTRQALKDDWLATGDLGSVDLDGYLKINGRKKDVIVTSGGKTVYPYLLEEQVRAHLLIDQCMVVGDDRPYLTALITLDAEAMRNWSLQEFSTAQGPASQAQAVATANREVQRAINAANSRVSHTESIRAFRILPTPFTQEENTLTPTLKVRRPEVLRKYAAEVQQMYSRARVDGASTGH